MIILMTFVHNAQFARFSSEKNVTQNLDTMVLITQMLFRLKILCKIIHKINKNSFL